MLQAILIGRPEAGAPRQGGIGPFIQSVLRYPAVLLRLGIAVAVWSMCTWLEWPVLPSLGFFAIEIYASLLLLRILADLLEFGQPGRIVTAMWLPTVVIAGAVYLLFFNDQGRELSIGLMDRNQKGFFLGLALIYWALNNWLSAKIGLAKHFSTPEKDQLLLFWGPRILGVCAHLVAACSLAAAAWKQPDLQGVRGLWLVVAAPVAIVLATIFAWLLDKAYISQRYQPQERSLARKLMVGVGVIELLLLGVLISAVVNNEQPGLTLAALWITASALFFLIVISLLRRKAPLGKNATAAARKQDQDAERRFTVICTLALAFVMVVATAAIWKWPMHIGHFFGSLTVACFAFGAFLALANVLELLATLLTERANRFGYNVQQHAVWAMMICFLLLPALLASLSHPFHRVRLCTDTDKCTAIAATGWAATPDKRPSVAEAANAWYAQAEPVYHALHPGEPVPMLIVATAGGGIRAAYWTATVLEQLERDLRWNRLARSSADKPPTENLLRNLLFAISGVSGGSVGAAAYAAAVHVHEDSGAEVKPTAYLQQDFLAPGIAAMVFIDGPANLLPDFGQIDRGEALELGFETASGGLVSHKFLSFFPTMDEVARMKSWRPALLFNATHQETGRRIITSHVKIERGVIFDSYDALQVLNADIRLSTAAHNSARFTYISPAGNLSSATNPKHNRGYVIDGGYFENYGAETALELASNAIEAIPDHQNKVKLVILQISSDPTLKKGRTLVRVREQASGCVVSSFEPEADKSNPADPANYLEVKDGNKNEGEGYVLPWANELSAPLVGIMSVREAHGTIAAEELASSICQGKGKVQQALQDPLQRNAAAGITGSTKADNTPNAPLFAHMAMCETSADGSPGISPPLGWVLSERTRDRFKDILNDCHNPTELVALESALGVPVQSSSNASDKAAKGAAR